jgi:uncharacterized protein YjiS (DUF1127 family)
LNSTNIDGSVTISSPSGYSMRLLRSIWHAFLAAQRAPVVRRVLHNLSLWHARAQQRHNLAMLSDYMLKDIGLTRVDVEREVRRPFWRE